VTEATQSAGGTSAVTTPYASMTAAPGSTSVRRSAGVTATRRSQRLARSSCGPTSTAGRTSGPVPAAGAAGASTSAASASSSACGRGGQPGT
jgi:hypothetical protein